MTLKQDHNIRAIYRKSDNKFFGLQYRHYAYGSFFFLPVNSNFYTAPACLLK